MHRPNTFQDMLLLAERADQAFMANNNGMLYSRNLPKYQQYNNRYSNTSRGGFTGRNQPVNYSNVSQYGNQSYKGPAPMVLGNVSDPPVCYYCNKPGHLRKDCYKLKNDQNSGRGGRSGRGQGRFGGRNQGRNVINNVSTEYDMQEVIRLGMAAVASKGARQVAMEN